MYSGNTAPIVAASAQNCHYFKKKLSLRHMVFFFMADSQSFYLAGERSGSG